MIHFLWALIVGVVELFVLSALALLALTLAAGIVGAVLMALTKMFGKS